MAALWMNSGSVCMSSLTPDDSVFRSNTALHMFIQMFTVDCVSEITTEQTRKECNNTPMQKFIRAALFI